jgi:hypothetical protein
VPLFALITVSKRDGCHEKCPLLVWRRVRKASTAEKVLQLDRVILLRYPERVSRELI